MAVDPFLTASAGVWTRRALLAGAVLGGLGLTGCSDGKQAGVDAVVCWARAYDTFAQVRDEATVAVVATAIEQVAVSGTQNPDGPRDSTLTTMSVERSFGAQLTQVAVRSLNGVDAHEAAQYRIGHTFLIFLAPHFWVSPSEQTGQFYAVGQLAAYRVSGPAAKRITTRDELPRQLTLEALLIEARQVG